MLFHLWIFKPSPHIKSPQLFDCCLLFFILFDCCVIVSLPSPQFQLVVVSLLLAFPLPAIWLLNRFTMFGKRHFILALDLPSPLEDTNRRMNVHIVWLLCNCQPSSHSAIGCSAIVVAISLPAIWLLNMNLPMFVCSFNPSPQATFPTGRCESSNRMGRL